MNRRSIFTLYTITAMGLALLPTSTIAQQKIAQEATRRDLDIRLSDNQASGWKPAMGFQSKRPSHLRGQRQLF